MGVLSRMASWVRTTPNGPADGGILANTPDGWVANQGGPVWWVGSDSAWPALGGGTAIPAAVRCHNLICDSISSMPIRMLRDGEAVPKPAWLADPMGARGVDGSVRYAGRPTIMTGPEFFGAILSGIVNYGNGYALYQRDDDGMPIQPFLPLDPTKVGHTVLPNNGKRYTIDGETVAADGSIELGGSTWYLLHARGPAPYDEHGFGLGVLQRFAQTFADGRTFRSFAESSMQSGVPAGYLKVSTPALTADQASELKASWMRAHGGSRRSIAVLNAVTDFTALSITPVDAAMIEMLGLNTTDIALAYGIEPAMIGAGSDSNTYANVESRMLQFVQYTLLPYIRRLEASLEQLVPAGYEIRVDNRGLLRADTKTRTETYKLALESGWMTVNEVRTLEDLAPFDDGDGRSDDDDASR
jgi:HK97 family phage portal protein